MQCTGAAKPGTFKWTITRHRLVEVLHQMKPIENFITVLGWANVGEYIPNPVMSISQGEERGIERLPIDPIDEPSVIHEIGHRCQVVESDGLIVLPDARLTQGPSQAYLTPIETHFSHGLGDDGVWEVMTMHQSMLGTVGNRHSSEHFNNFGLSVRRIRWHSTAGNISLSSH